MFLRIHQKYINITKIITSNNTTTKQNQKQIKNKNNTKQPENTHLN